MNANADTNSEAHISWEHHPTMSLVTVTLRCSYTDVVLCYSEALGSTIPPSPSYDGAHCMNDSASFNLTSSGSHNLRALAFLDGAPCGTEDSATIVVQRVFVPCVFVCVMFCRIIHHYSTFEIVSNCRAFSPNFGTDCR